MDKDFVDKTITAYVKKIYGFALSKTKNIDIAEELASKITFEVYISLLNVEQIYNINSYIFRIANNIYARFVIEEMNENPFSKSDLLRKQIMDAHQDEIHYRLRREISYLSRMQREIVVMHYFNKIKLKEIAILLNLPIGTVSWHLHEARDRLKSGISEDRETIVNKRNHEIFKEMKILGFSGISFTETAFYFKLKFSQSIAYLAYHTAKTTNEIAKELAIPTAFVENEVNYLVYNGFMLKMPCNKYLTNIYIIEQNKKREEKIFSVLKKYAKIVCDKYIPLLFDIAKKEFIHSESKFYVPENDFNFLMWSIVSYACSKKLCDGELDKELLKYMQRRKDGGHYIAIATVHDKNDESAIDPSCKGINNSSNYIHAGTYALRRRKEQSPSKAWLFYSQFDDRAEKHSEYTIKLFDILYEFMTGKIKREPEQIDKYINLFEKGLLLSDKSRNPQRAEYVNTIVTTFLEEEFVELFPEMTGELKAIGKQLDEEMYSINKEYFPEQMHGLCRVLNQNCLKSGQMRIHILNLLLQNGKLKPLKKHQKKTVNMILFSDILPKEENN